MLRTCLRTLLATALSLVGLAASAATFPVNNLNDGGPGSLRQAILDANAAFGADFITFNPGLTGVIVLTNELLIKDSLTIQGPCADCLVVSGNHNSRVFHVGDSAVLIYSLGIADGLTSANGGGVLVSNAMLTLTGCVVSASSASAGGGIYSHFFSTVNLEACAVSTNTANIAGLGGGIYNDANCVLNVNLCTLSRNSASSSGGGIYNAGTLAVTNCTLSFNSMGTGGGGLYHDENAGHATIKGCSIYGNGNSAAGFGGGVWSGTTMAILNSTIASNRCNYAGAGIGHFMSSGTLSLNHCTVVGNRSTTSGAGGVQSGGLLSVRIQNSLIASNSAGSGAQEVGGAFFSEGYNLVRDGTGSSGLVNAINQDQVGPPLIDPYLLPLRNNGGPTLSMALPCFSPAANKGTSGGLSTDQRGYPRPASVFDAAKVVGGDGSDIGAVESCNIEVHDLNRIGPADGKWEDLSGWSGGAPHAGVSVSITNPSSKIIFIDGTTVTNAPNSLTVGSLLLSAPVGSVNTLSLNNAGLATPLRVQNSLSLQRGGAITINNSSLQLDGASHVCNGAITLVSGNMTAAGNFSVADTINSTGVVTLAGGTLNVTNGITFVGRSGFGELRVNAGTAFLKQLKLGGAPDVVATLLKDIWPGPHDSFSVASNALAYDILGHYPGGYLPSAELNGSRFFPAPDEEHGFELWKTDGTEAGTRWVKDLTPGPGSSYPRWLASVNGAVFFAANAGANGAGLWKTDGSEDGTMLFKAINPGPYGVEPHVVSDGNGTLYFTVIDGQNALALWKSDGTLAGTHVVKTFSPLDAIPFYSGLAAGNVNGIPLVFFSLESRARHRGELWMSDGTLEGTVLLKWTPDAVITPYTKSLATGNGTLLVAINPCDDSGSTELWRSDGTVTGTQLIKQFPRSIDHDYGLASIKRTEKAGSFS